jgi:hypothetical protein
LLLWQSWIGVFGQYPACNSLLGLPCVYVPGPIPVKQCCDDITSGQYVSCFFSYGSTRGEWAGPGSCENDLQMDEAHCVSLTDSSDICVAGLPVLPMMEFTNFCQLTKTTTVLHGLG